MVVVALGLAALAATAPAHADTASGPAAAAEGRAPNAVDLAATATVDLAATAAGDRALTTDREAVAPATADDPCRA